MEELRQSQENPYATGLVPKILYITQEQLASIFHHSRSRETSLDPEFRSESVRDRVQCMPTTFVMQTLFGGFMMIEKFLVQDGATNHIKNIPHFFNDIDGRHIDFTRGQLAYWEFIRWFKVMKISDPITLKNQCKEDYYAFFAETNIKEKEQLLFEQVKKRINIALSADVDLYLAADKKIQLLD